MNPEREFNQTALGNTPAHAMSSTMSRNYRGKVIRLRDKLQSNITVACLDNGEDTEEHINDTEPRTPDAIMLREHRHPLAFKLYRGEVLSVEIDNPSRINIGDSLIFSEFDIHGILS